MERVERRRSNSNDSAKGEERVNSNNYNNFSSYNTCTHSTNPTSVAVPSVTITPPQPINNTSTTLATAQMVE